MALLRPGFCALLWALLALSALPQPALGAALSKTLRDKFQQLAEDAGNAVHSGDDNENAIK